MKISLRGWLVVGAILAAVAALFALCPPLLTAAGSSPRKVSAGSLTEKSLGQMLEAMGLKPKKTEQRYDFSFKGDYQGAEWELNLSAVLSQNGESLWVMAWLDELPRSAASVPRTALLRLLSQNDKMGNGKFFAYIAGNRRFVLQRVVENKDLTTATFRDLLKDVGSSVVQTHSYWSVANWKTSKIKHASAEQASPSTAVIRPAVKSADKRNRAFTKRKRVR